MDHKSKNPDDEVVEFRQSRAVSVTLKELRHYLYGDVIRPEVPAAETLAKPLDARVQIDGAKFVACCGPWSISELADKLFEQVSRDTLVRASQSKRIYRAKAELIAQLLRTLRDDPSICVDSFTRGT